MSLRCPKCHSSRKSQSGIRRITKAGRFYRRSTGHWIRRFQCLECEHRFSRATFHYCYRQKKRHKNYLILKLLASGNSQRRTARLLCLARRTVERKVKFLGHYTRLWQMLEQAKHPKSVRVEFDDMETFEHTKCRPLSLSLAVESDSRRLMGFEISQMPASGKLAEKARKKYGKRKDERKQGRRRLFRRLKPLIEERAEILSDQNPHYPDDIKKFFPHATHLAFKGRKPRDHGQGELKEGAYDPLFSLNHTAAMIRYGVASMIRKTWCTTKSAQGLRDRLSIYMHYHNTELI